MSVLWQNRLSIFFFSTFRIAKNVLNYIRKGKSNELAKLRTKALAFRKEPMNLFASRILALREYMAQENITVYYVPTADFHGSEYISNYFKIREYLSGFTGSAGCLFVTADEAGLFTDGRYFIQAENELMGSGITLYRSGTEGVPTPEEKLCELLADGGTLGFDGRLLSFAFLENIQKRLPDVPITFRFDAILPDALWKDRPQLSFHPAYRLADCYSGKPATAKLSELRETMKKITPSAIYKNKKNVPVSSVRPMEAEAYLISSLDEIAWLFNIRGTDIVNNPVVLSYALITGTENYLYLSEQAMTPELSEALQADGITIRPYDAIYEDVRTLPVKTILLDTRRVNYTLAASLPPEITILDHVGPIQLAKAIKNETELKNLANAHIKDGIATTKFMYWLKKNIGKETITELSAADHLLNLRKELDGFLEPSFETISAYNKNAAMMHYCATPKSFAVLEPKGFLLVDSGGQYLEGTTDVTRTYVLGELPHLWKQHYTAVLRGMLNLADARFLYGCRGVNLDILARGPLWQTGLDYRCGTGHGVGYLLNVHEAPNGFRWRIVPERSDSCVLEAGMVTTDEPGVYVENSHGIRIENELVCCKGEKNEYGQFMYFDTLTMTPIDLDAVLPEEMTAKERRLLNTYHKKVYETLLPYLTEDEGLWLKEATREI